MKLRSQLIFISLFTLALPWAGCEYIREMENTLRQGQAQGLLTTTKTIAHVLSYEDSDVFQHEILSDPSSHADNNIYTFKLDSKLKLDGYADDWGGLRNDLRYFPNQLGDAAVGNNQVGLLAARDKKFIYLFIRVSDEQVIYHDPSQSLLNGDRLQLLISDKNNRPKKYFIQTSAPGHVYGKYINAKDSLDPKLVTNKSIRGEWQDTAEGYNIELRLPIKLVPGKLNFSIVDVDQDNGKETAGWYGSWDQRSNLNNGLLIQPSEKLRLLLEKLQQDNARLSITNIQGWLLASSGSPHRPLSGDENIELNETLLAILNQLYRFIMNLSDESAPPVKLAQGRASGRLIEQALQNQSGTSWFKPARSNNAIVSATYPVIIEDQVVAVVIADQNSDAILTLTSHALSRLVSLSSMAIIIAVAGLLGYATYLSLRIRKLRNATEQIISSEGQLSEHFTASSARDELGDLSRSFKAMHSRLNEYTQYLRSLASKLSHELRTPLAVVQSSLDNLSAGELPDDKKIYAQRAQEGSERLGKIITAMSEASRVEQSILSAEIENFNLGEVITSSIAAYRDIYPARQFVESHAGDTAIIKGSPELIVQLLDKLVDNAVDFSQDGSSIHINITTHKQQVQLAIRNEGEWLPEQMQHQLFDSMVSLRDKKNGRPHLGLGLYIVKLITESHGGSVTAANCSQPKGVEFVVSLPVSA